MKKPIIISIANQKGGVGKTTTTVNVGASLSLLGKKVLIIDFDPQGSSTTYLNYKYNETQLTINDLMNTIVEKKSCNIADTILFDKINGVDFIPADIRFSIMETQLVNTRCRETVLQRILKSNNLDYDYILIDCPPFLGNLLFNALTASDYVLIPVAAQNLALEGIPLLTDTIEDVRTSINSELKIIGVVATLAEKTRMSNQVIDILQEHFKDKFLGCVSKSSAAQESSADGIALCLYTKNQANQYRNKLADEYMNIAKEVIVKGGEKR